MFQSKANTTDLIWAVSQYPIHILINKIGGPAPGLISEATEASFTEALLVDLQ